MDKKKLYLILSWTSTVLALLFSLMSFVKLKSVGINDYNTLLLVFKIVNRDIILLSIAIIFLLNYLRQKDK